VLQQVDTPAELYANPVNLFVAGFIGSPAMNFFPAQIERDRVRLPFVEVPLDGALRQALSAGDGGSREVIAGLRPEHFHDPALGDARGVPFEAAIELVESLGSEIYAHFSFGGESAQSQELAELAADSGAQDVPSAGQGARAVARLDAASRVKAGERARLAVDPSKLHLFDASGGANLARVGGAEGA